MSALPLKADIREGAANRLLMTLSGYSAGYAVRLPKEPARPLGPLKPPAHPLCRQPEPRRLRPGADHAPTGRTSVANKSLSVP